MINWNSVSLVSTVAHRQNLWPVFELPSLPDRHWFILLDRVILCLQPHAVRTCSSSSTKRLKDVSALFYLPQWIWCASPRRCQTLAPLQPFATSFCPLLFLFLCWTRAGAVRRSRPSDVSSSTPAATLALIELLQDEVMTQSRVLNHCHLICSLNEVSWMA